MNIHPANTGNTFARMLATPNRMAPNPGDILGRRSLSKPVYPQRLCRLASGTPLWLPLWTDIRVFGM
jgi:hypothetical protein